MVNPGAPRALPILCLLTFASCGSPSKQPDAETTAAVRTAVDVKSPSFAAKDGERRRQLWQEEQRFYKQSGYRLAWSDGKRPRSQVEGLIRALRAAGEKGLEPADYHVDELDTARKAPFTREQAIDFDLRATAAYLHYASDLSRGTVDPEDVDPQWRAAPRDIDLHNAPAAGLGEGNIGGSLQKLAPASPQYVGLKNQLAKDRAAGDAAAVHQIAMNMERWRWLPDDLGPRYLLVNIPAFRLDAIENGRSVLDMKVAKYLLRDQAEWTDAKIAEAMAAGEERSVALKQPVPIYLVYFTAWEENGALKRVADVYGHDRRHTAAENTQ